MSRPWQEDWPRVGASGRRSYIVGFYDHDKRERCRSFQTAGGVGGAREWMRDFRAAERRGGDSLRRFLLDLDAREANVAEGRLLGEVVELYFSLDADPRLEGGLAPHTYDNYKRTARGHILGLPMQNHRRKVVGRKAYGQWLARQPASAFNGPQTSREWRERMRQAGQSQTSIKGAWKVLSAIISWAAGSHEVPEIHTNGCLLANERKSNRSRVGTLARAGEQSVRPDLLLVVAPLNPDSSKHRKLHVNVGFHPLDFRGQDRKTRRVRSSC